MAGTDINNIKEQALKAISKINEKNPYYLIAGVLVVVLVLDYALILQFQFGTLRSLNPQLKTVSEDVRKAREDMKQVDKYRDEVKKLTDQRDKFSVMIKTKEDIPLILEQVSRLASKNRISIEEIMPNPADQDVVMKNSDGQYIAVPIEVQARGGYHDFGRFLNQMEGEGMFFNIPEFTITGSVTDAARHSLSFTVNAIIFEAAQKI